MKPLPIGAKITIQGPKGEINESAIAVADKVIDKYNKKYQRAEFYRFDLPRPTQLWCDAAEWRSWLSGTTNWAKRYDKYVFDSCRVHPPTFVTGELGEILSRYADTYTEYVVDFVDKTGDWNWVAGKFGENRDSCWWNRYNDARIAFFANGGAAMRFWDKSKGIGRCWVWREKDNYYLFNAYHRDNVQLSRMAQALAELVGGKYNNIGIKIPNAYTNGGNGMVVTDGAMPSGVTLNIFGGELCCICRKTIQEGTARVDAHGNRYHPSCYEESVYQCEACEEDVMHDDAFYLHDNIYCENCFNEVGFICGSCGDAFRTEDVMETPLRSLYCSDCFNDAYFTCENCGVVTDREDDEYVVGDYSYCPDCVYCCTACGHHSINGDNEGDDLCVDCHAKKEAENEIPNS